jgi:SAM-dependent methyltransferase
MAFVKRLAATQRDYFKSLYARGLEQEAEWLRRGAPFKADSIQSLLALNSIIAQSVMELGCGTGAVLRECWARGLARRYIGVDYSPEAIAYLRATAPQITAIQADLNEPDFAIPEPVDLVYLTHVIQHLDDPARFLSTTLKKLTFNYLIIEIPLEDLLGTRIKHFVRDRRANRSGHMHFFNATSFDRLLTANGLRILGRRRYIPFHSADTVRFLQSKNGRSRVGVSRAFAGAALRRVTYQLWSRLYYAHYAVLCCRADRVH